MKIAAEELGWHDAGIDAIALDEPTQRLTFEVEVSIFDRELGVDGDPQPGQLVFERVEQLQVLHDLKGTSLHRAVKWEILQVHSERVSGLLRCHLILLLHRLDEGRNEASRNST